MRTILVTGPIGSGKSELCRYLSSLDFPVYDCDSRTKMLYSLVPGLKCSIEERLGIPWQRIGSVFAEPDKLRTLEEMVYPHVLEDLKAWKAAQTAPLVFVESAVALDKPQFDGLYDRVLLVTAPYELRVKRNPRAAERDALQHFDPARIDLTVVNDGTQEELYLKTRQLLCKLI
ncbi:MAG: dephospho-CoA kinase [Bacteroidales bacterium]|jgi:dephospho-CoA kinase|nr:dephospho-CoA kinase [Bacteroidales bacterium]